MVPILWSIVNHIHMAVLLESFKICVLLWTQVGSCKTEQN